MRIRRITAYQVDLPLHEGRYVWSGGKSVDVFDSTVVRIETDTGLAGHGEVCPLGPAYLPAYAAGARTGLAELAPRLLGEDPRALGRLGRRMDQLLKGHPYVKSAIDMACWVNSSVTTSIAEGAPRRADGRLAASAAPGLGVTPRPEVLGRPVLDAG